MNNSFEESRTLNARMIAEHQQISRRRVYELFQLKIEYGGIPNYCIGRSRRVKKDDYLKWIEDAKQRSGAGNDGRYEQ